MDFKTPTPLGDNKKGKESITEEILKINEEKKNSSKLNLSKFTLKKMGEKTNSTQIVHKKEKKKEKTSPYSNLILKERISTYIKNNKEKIIDISLVAVPLLILLILIIVILNYTKSEPYRLASEFLKRIEERDYEHAYELTTETFKTVTTFDNFKEDSKKLNTVDISNPKVIKKKIEKPEGMGEYAYIKYRISGYYVDITVFNDDTNWGIHSIQISTDK